MRVDRAGAENYHPHAAGDVHDMVLRQIPSGAGGVLDAACGDGTVSRALAERGYAVEAVDLPDTAPFAVPANVHYRSVDLNRGLPFDDRSFDLIVSIETIEHLENPAAFLRELGRVAKQGATVYLTTPNVASIWSRLSFAVFGRPLWFHPWDLNPLGHVTPMFAHIAEQFARSAGLEVVAKRYSEARVPLLKAKLPVHTAFFGECTIFELRKR